MFRWTERLLTLPAMITVFFFSTTAFALALGDQIPWGGLEIEKCHGSDLSHCSGSILKDESHSTTSGTLGNLLDALDVMQSEYYDLPAGTWPSSIDWTAAVLGTHVSASLTTIISTVEPDSSQCQKILGWENWINRYFSHLIGFYFGENFFSLRNQAYDDMLWVVLGWLENVKFSTLYTSRYWQASGLSDPAAWHGTQMRSPAAHRARTFYDLASQGWDTDLCGGGMTWNPALEPYKNAITNELFISASIAMYLYFPGDNNSSPFFGSSSEGPRFPPHNKAYLASAVKGYKWLRESNMTNFAGLYMDGFHITGWNGTRHPGTKQCDKLQSMVYTYNQGVILSGLKGLWIATNSRQYLAEGHDLIENVIFATGWRRPDSRSWSGLGRGGVLEELCDSRGSCSQNGHTFKGIFFHHLTEFCRPLWTLEEDFMRSELGAGLDQVTYRYHEYRCLTYGAWIKHNAEAALKTKSNKGLFGTWWGRKYNPSSTSENTGETSSSFEIPSLPPGAIDYRNDDPPHLADSDEPDSHPYSASTDDLNDRGRGRTVETQSGGVSILRALWQWEKLMGKSNLDLERDDGF